MLGGTIDVTMAEQTHSEADLVTIGELTLWHQMPHLPARHLIQLNCERWPVWNPSLRARIAQARRLDDSRDWYFPLITRRWTPKIGEIVPPEPCWTWSGIWHESAHHADTERSLALPPMTYLRQDWRYASFMLYHMLASEGGLLLLGTRRGRETAPIRRSSRLNKPVAGTNVPDTSVPEWSTANGSDLWEKMSPLWTRLLVCNPLTKQYRELPEANCEEMGTQQWRLASYSNAQVRMVVDDEANSYQVILLLQQFVLVYKSTTNSWKGARFQDSVPWCRRFSPWVYYSAAGRVGGRAYVADVRTIHQTIANAIPGLANTVRTNPISHLMPVGTLQLFEIDAEAGTWDLLHQYTLRKLHFPVLNPHPELYPFDMGVVDNVELMGCMGDLYAVVPARLHDVVTVSRKQTHLWKNELCDVYTRRLKNPKNRPSVDLRELEERIVRELKVKYMPLVFYVMQLRAQGDEVYGDGVDHAVLRIEVPEIRSEQAFQSYKAREERMYERTDVHRSGGGNWFNCEARGSVIWVSYEDYLLSYDVVSRKSKTQLIPAHRREGSATPIVRLAYRPSFHMKP